MCATEAVAPFSCNVYLISGTDTPGDPDTAYLKYQNADAWFEQAGSVHQLVLERGDRRIHVPLSIDGTTAVTAATPDTRFATARCRSDEDCKFRAWLATLFSKPMTLSLTGTTLTATAGEQNLKGVLTKRPHAYPNLVTKSVDGRTLFVYHPGKDGATMAAFDGGTLSTNKAGCITDGSDVLILADTTRLHDDGSIDVDGRHIEQGATLNIGGGEATPPQDTHCGVDLNYWYF